MLAAARRARGRPEVSSPTRSWLWLMLGIGLAVRLGLAFGTHGEVFDLQSYVVVKHALREDPLHVYAAVDTAHLYRWPYPPGFFALIAGVGVLAKGLGLAFTSLIRLPAIAADLAIAWLVGGFLAHRGAGERTRLAAVAAVAGGPSFVAASGYHGQLDSVAILPAVAAVALWDRLPPERRALVAGLLIGVGGAIKTVPLLMLLALLPSCRSWREAVQLAAAAAAVPVLALAPFLAADAHGVLRVLDYHSLPGVGGISLLAQPDLAQIWLVTHPHVRLSGLSHVLQGRVGEVFSGLGIAAAALLGLRVRARAHEAAVLLWLAVFALSVNFGPRYVVWGLPFFLMSGYVGQALALQAALLAPTVLLYAAPFQSQDVLYAYVPFMLITWAGFVVWFAARMRRLARAGSRPPPLSAPEPTPSVR